MKITEITAENFKRLKKVHITPGDRKVMLICGNNGQGKTSLIQAIEAATGGAKAAPEMPVHAGKKRADIRIEWDDGDLVVHRKFHSRGGTSLEVRDRTGTLKGPQKILDKLVGSRFLDPLDFMRQPEKKQRDILLGCVDLSIDLDAHDAKRAQVYRQRADANRDMKRMQHELSTSPDPGEIPAPIPVEEITTRIQTLLARKHEQERAATAIETAAAEVKRSAADCDMAASHVAECRANLLSAQSGLDDAQSGHRELATRLEAMQQECTHSEADSETLLSDIRRDQDELERASRHAEARSRQLVRKSKRDTAAERLRLSTDTADGLTRQLDDLDDAKAAALEAADMPIADLEIQEAGLAYKGMPLSQASGAEQLHVSLAIAVALSPEMRDIWMTDGSLLDANSLELVEKFAAEHDVRVWLERVGVADTSDNVVVIEDGTVAT